MKKSSALYLLYALVIFLSGTLMFFRLILWALELFAPGNYSVLIYLIHLLPEPVLELPALLQEQEKLWTAWTWVWEHSWKVFFTLLLLPKLKGMLHIVSTLRNLVVELVRRLDGAVRWIGSWMIRLRCRGVVLIGCQYVIVGYQDGSEQVVNIRESRIWSDWREHPNGQVCLKSDDTGNVSLEWAEDQHRRLEDRCPVSPETTLKEHYPELRAVEHITLYDDLGR